VLLKKELHQIARNFNLAAFLDVVDADEGARSTRVLDAYRALEAYILPKGRDPVKHHQ
jgi:hypothetical protein